MGKTLDLGLTFPNGVFFAPAMSGLTPLNGLAGFVPKQKATVSAFKPIIQWLRDHHDDEKVSGVVIDDIALIGDRTVAAYTKDLGTSYDRWNALNADLLELFELATSAPYFVAVTSHEVGPGEAKNTFLPGGPKLPSKPAGDALAKNAGCILRSVVDDMSPAADATWPVIYSCDRSDANFTFGDRNGFALKQNPLNMREILHAGGVTLPRLHDWQEGMVEQLASLIVEGKMTAEVLAKARGHMETKYKADIKALWWTFRDARARAYMRTHAVDRLAGMEKSLIDAHGSL
jgi:hypothetical protein